MARLDETIAAPVVAPAAAPLGDGEAWRQVGRLLGSGATIVVILAAWELVARSGAVTAFLLPPLSIVLERIWDDTLSGDLIANLGQTMYRVVIGFAIAATLGVVLGIGIARNRAARWFFDPIISVCFPMPKIAFLPVFGLWLGYYDLSKVTMIVFSAIFPVVIATVTSTEGVEKELVWSARSLGAGSRQLLWEIVLPAALPQILTGLQVALPVSMIVAVVCEILMGGAGIGGAMITASRFADSPGVFAGIIEIAVAGYVLVKGIALLRRHLLRWHQEAQEPTTV